MTDGMAWSGFDSAAANIAGGADAVFRAIGVSRAIVDRPGMQATFRQYVAYFETMARLSGDQDFGHRFGLRTRAARSGIPGHLILNARQFRDGLEDLARTLPTLVEGLGLKLVEDRDPPALVWTIAPSSGDATQFTRFVLAYVRATEPLGRRYLPVGELANKLKVFRLGQHLNTERHYLFASGNPYNGKRMD